MDVLGFRLNSVWGGDGAALLASKQALDHFEKSIQEPSLDQNQLRVELEALLKMEGVFDLKSLSGQTLLHLMLEGTATQKGCHWSLLWQQVPAEKLNWNQRNHRGELPLQVFTEKADCFQESYPAIFQVLKRAPEGAYDPRVLHQTGMTALQELCSFRFSWLEQLLEEYLELIECRGESLLELLEQRGESALSPLGLGVFNRSVGAVGVLLKAGADPRVLGCREERERERREMELVEKGFAEWEAELLRETLNLEWLSVFVKSYGRLSRKEQIGCGDFSSFLTTLLQKKGRSFFEQSILGWQGAAWEDLARIAVLSGSVGALKILVEKGFNLKESDPNGGANLLFHGIQAKEWGVCRELCRQGVDFSQVTEGRCFFENTLIGACPCQELLEALIPTEGLDLQEGRETLWLLRERKFFLGDVEGGTSISGKKEPFALVGSPIVLSRFHSLGEVTQEPFVGRGLRLLSLMGAAARSGNGVSFLWLAHRLLPKRYKSAREIWS